MTALGSGVLLAEASGAGGSMWSTVIMVVAMVAIFYFFLIRPENKKKKKLKEMRESMSVGDHITTIGGIMGRIVHLNDEIVVFETGEDRVRVQVAKWAVSTVGKDPGEQAPR